MTAEAPLPAFRITGQDRPSRWLVTCDHACNAVPMPLDPSLGIAPQDMARHIAYDIGARGLAMRLAARLDAPMIDGPGYASGLLIGAGCSGAPSGPVTL